MLRRSVAAFIVALAACAVVSCGIKGPLKPLPAKPGAPEPSNVPQPTRPDAETPVLPAPLPAPETKPQ